MAQRFIAARRRLPSERVPTQSSGPSVRLPGLAWLICAGPRASARVRPVDRSSNRIETGCFPGPPSPEARDGRAIASAY
jgi:hypothetical protein